MADEQLRIEVPVTLFYCFSHEGGFGVHLREHNSDRTLCGQAAFGNLERRLVTCEECKRLKPKVLGGAS